MQDQQTVQQQQNIFPEGLGGQPPSNGVPARIARQAGRALGYLERRSLTGILEDFRTVMLRSPEGALSSAILMGFVLGSLVRSRR